MRQLNITMHFFYHYYFLFFFIYGFFIFRSKIKLNVISLNLTSSQVPLSRNRLILRGSVPIRGRATPRIFIHIVTVDLCQVLPPSSRPHWHLLLGWFIPGQFLHNQFLLFVLMCLVIIDPAQKGGAQLRLHLARLVCCNVPIGSTVCSQPCRDHLLPTSSIVGWEHQSVLPVDLHICGLVFPCSEHLGGSRMCLLFYCWLHHRVESISGCYNIDGEEMLCHWCIESLHY